MPSAPVWLFAVFGFFASGCAIAKPPPMSIEAMASASYEPRLRKVADVPPADAYSAYLVAYESQGLTVNALVAVPASEPPAQGFPILVANHGFHPDPPRYGFTADGIDARPGDYYRSIPSLYAARGFLVVMPDYRGHSNSEGLEYTRGFLATGYYTEDVLALLDGLGAIAEGDTANVFLWGHSLGGEVTLRTALASEAIRGASLWSAVGGEIWDQAYYYGRYEDRAAVDTSNTPNESIDRLRADIEALDSDFDIRSIEPLQHLRRLRVPVILHHAVGDQGALFEWSERLAKSLYLLGKSYDFYGYESDDHFFEKDDRVKAVDRDVAFFRNLMR